MIHRTQTTQKYFFQYLQSFVHAVLQPHLTPALSIPLLCNFIEKHHLSFIFMPLFKDHGTLMPSFVEESEAKVKQYLVMMSGMLELIRTFQKQDIWLLILKGIPLSTQLYGNQCLRNMGDIDVLIQPDALEHAHECLLQLGYQLHSQLNPIILLHDNAFLMNYANEVLYWHPEKKIAIDLKWRLFSVHRQTPSWSDRTKTLEMTIFSQKVTILNHEQNFLYLSIHAAKHNWERLKWLIDLAVFYRKIPLNWEQVISLARETDAIRPLLETVVLLKRWFQIEINAVPHTVWDRIIVGLRLLVIQAQWCKAQKKTIKNSKYKMYLLSMLLYERLSQKRYYFVRLLLLRRNALSYMSRSRKSSIYEVIMKGFFCSRL